MFLFYGDGGHRDVDRGDRRQRQMCMSDRFSVVPRWWNERRFYDAVIGLFDLFQGVKHTRTTVNGCGGVGGCSLRPKVGKWSCVSRPTEKARGASISLSPS